MGSMKVSLLLGEPSIEPSQLDICIREGKYADKKIKTSTFMSDMKTAKITYKKGRQSKAGMHQVCKQESIYTMKQIS